MKTIAVDIDDVLSMSAQAFTSFSNETWGTTLEEADFTEDLGSMWGVDHKEVVKRLKTYFASDAIQRSLPIEGAEPALRELARWYKLVAVTSRIEQIMPMTQEWVGHNFAGIPLEVYSAGIWDKLDEGARMRTKSEVCVRLRADYLIDDQLKHCIAVSECGIEAVLFGNYAWNQAGLLPGGVKRAEDWQAVLEYFTNARA
jgi:hypothetical protein